jgi:hypothetical protein
MAVYMARNLIISEEGSVAGLLPSVDACAGDALERQSVALRSTRRHSSQLKR